MKTKVMFLYNKDNQDLFAYFPEIIERKDDVRACFAHIGQHSTCTPLYAEQSRNATPEEYNSLKSELEQYPYNYELEIVQK